MRLLAPTRLIGFLLSTLFALLVSNQAMAIKLIGMRAIDVNGNLLQIGIEDSNLKPAVITFINSQCSISQAYLKDLNQLNQQARKQGLTFYGVIAEPNTPSNEVKAFAAQQGFDFPVIHDISGNLTNELEPRVLPETFVISKFDDLLYHGRIDDRFTAQGKLKPGATSQDLNNAIAEISKGKKVSNARTAPVGCSLPARDAGQLPETVSYNQHVAPVINANCAECHRENGIAPFPLVDYKQSKAFSYMIHHVTKERLMPPWKARPNSGHYLNERVISDYEIALLEKWAKTGAAEGEARYAAIAPQLETSEWRLGKPDIIITMPEEFEVPASGPDIYRYFVAKNAIPKDLEIAAIDFKPGDPSVVHHCNFFVDYGKKARKKDAEDPAPGFSVFGTGSFFSYWDEDQTAAGLGAWAPGGNPIRYPEGMGVKLPGGADFVFEIHYHPTGKKAVDRSQFAIYLSKKPVKTVVSSLFMGTNTVLIEPGDKNYKRHFWMDVPADMELVDIAPHMHYLGTEAKVEVTYPNGEKKLLMDVVWDFRWQGAYFFREPVKIPKGSRIDAFTAYDNSADNPYNPYNPPVPATWGWGTDQEMGEMYLTVVTKGQRSLRKLQKAAQQSWFRPSDPAISMGGPMTAERAIDILRRYSTWETNGEAVAQQVATEAKLFDDVTKSLKKAFKKNRKDAKAMEIYATMNAIGSQFASGWSQSSMYSEAIKYYEKALKLDPTLWDARFTMATGYAGESKESYQQYAIGEFKKLIKIQEKAAIKKAYFAKTYEDLGDLYKRRGELKKAKQVWEQGYKHHPNSMKLVERLGKKKTAPLSGFFVSRLSNTSFPVTTPAATLAVTE